MPKTAKCECRTCKVTIRTYGDVNATGKRRGNVDKLSVMTVSSVNGSFDPQKTSEPQLNPDQFV